MKPSKMIKKAADELSDEIFGCHVHLSGDYCHCRADEDAVRNLIEKAMFRLVTDLTLPSRENTGGNDEAEPGFEGRAERWSISSRGPA
jgi:hypothetical protein